MTSLADEFFDKQKRANKRRWDQVKEKFPVNSPYDEERFRLGEPPHRRRKRVGPAGGVPRAHRRKFTAEEWMEYRKAKKKYLDEWYQDLHFAKELSEQGM